MKFIDKFIAGVVWLEKFAIFSPQNLQSTQVENGLQAWGNYAIGANRYPNLFDVFIKYSPTAEHIIRRKVELAVGNIDPEIQAMRTTLSRGFTNTVRALVDNIARDAFRFNGAFAVWVGYDGEGKVNELCHIPIEEVRYYTRNADRFTGTEESEMIAIVDDKLRGAEKLYYPYDPTRAAEQAGRFEEENSADGRLQRGQILFYNPATSQTYPDCVFNNLLPLLLTDAGLDTSTMSYFANGDILRTYKKQTGALGAAIGGGAPIGGGYVARLLSWNDRDAVPEQGSDYTQTGVKSAGAVEYLTTTYESETPDKLVKTAGVAQFADEYMKQDERIGRRLCLAAGMPYEYLFKTESGLLNQTNRETLIRELNVTLEPVRSIFETVINDVLEHSVLGFRLSILPIGGNMESVAAASDNITEQ